MNIAHVLLLSGLLASCNKPSASDSKNILDVKVVDSSVIVTWSSKGGEAILKEDLKKGHSLVVPNLLNSDGTIAKAGTSIHCSPLNDCLSGGVALTSDIPCNGAGCGDANIFSSRYALPVDSGQAAEVVAILETLADPRCDAGGACLKASEDLQLEYKPSSVAVGLSEGAPGSMVRFSIKAKEVSRSGGNGNDAGKGQ